jgi:AraC family transcriptional regulator
MREVPVSVAAGHGGRVDVSPVADLRGFDPHETHSVCNRRNWRVHATSAGLGWRNLFVSSQTEIPEKADYNGVRDHLLVVHRNGPASVSLTMAGRSTVKQVGAGGATLCPGGEGFTVRIFDTVDSAHIYLRHEMIERVIDQRGIATAAPRVQPFFGIQDPLIEQLAFACVAMLGSPSKSAAFYVDQLAWAMAAHLVEAHGLCANVPAVRQYAGLTDRQLKRAEEYMLENMDGRLGIEDLAAAAGLSPVYFARQFKLRTGSTPHRHLRSLRVKRAKELLRGDYRSIAEIALTCGFCHQEHMTRVFRAECGTTPAAFRRDGND